MSRQRKRRPAGPLSGPSPKASRAAPAPHRRSAPGSRRTAWIVGGVIAAVAMVALIAATVSVGGLDGDQQQTGHAQQGAQTQHRRYY